MMTASRPLKGIVLVALATLTFAAADVLTKQLSMRHPVAIVVAVRYLVNLGLLAVVLYPRLGAGLWRVQRRGLVLLRGLFLALSSLTMALALRLMPVGETVAIIYLSPFAVMLLAGPLLGEKVTRWGWIWAVMGFAGVLLILRPGGGLDPYGVAFALINAGFATGYHLLTRLLAGSETTAAMLFQTALVGSVFFSLGALGSLDQLDIAATDYGWMAVLGALAAAGHFLFTAAYREAPASLLAPVNYLHLVWAAGLGWVIFGHMPEAPSLAGMALVCASGVALALGAKRRR
ncbi:MAG: Permease [Rhodobacteraceae bacterium]|uniref:DMT family transporter n=1 Tax=Cypionkella sp. TaxID=2811411 RepID=UPI0013256C34|nr:DMT family transporter [Cypionkella sp.]KAF0172185.1 MAG: Permease [Paracoccaceae bacterium]MDO8327703.1 DMT family transporter [Cypionkella sp.]